MELRRTLRRGACTHAFRCALSVGKFIAIERGELSRSPVRGWQIQAEKSSSPPKLLLLFEFAFADAFKDGEAGFFGVANGEGFEFLRRAEIGNDFADGFATERALFERRAADWAVQSEFAAANFAVAIDQFVFVERHLLQ